MVEGSPQNGQTEKGLALFAEPVQEVIKGGQREIKILRMTFAIFFQSERGREGLHKRRDKKPKIKNSNLKPWDDKSREEGMMGPAFRIIGHPDDDPSKEVQRGRVDLAAIVSIPHPS